MEKKSLNKEKYNLQMKIFKLYQVLYQGRKPHFELLRIRQWRQRKTQMRLCQCRRCCMNVDWKLSKCFGVALFSWENTALSLCSPKIGKVDRRWWTARSDKRRKKRLWEVDGGPRENRTFDGKAQLFFFLGPTKQYFASVHAQENTNYSWERK